MEFTEMTLELSFMRDWYSMWPYQTKELDNFQKFICFRARPRSRKYISENSDPSELDIFSWSNDWFLFNPLIKRQQRIQSNKVSCLSEWLQDFQTMYWKVYKWRQAWKWDKIRVLESQIQMLHDNVWVNSRDGKQNSSLWPYQSKKTARSQDLFQQAPEQSTAGNVLGTWEGASWWHWKLSMGEVKRAPVLPTQLQKWDIWGEVRIEKLSWYGGTSAYLKFSYPKSPKPSLFPSLPEPGIQDSHSERSCM